MLLFEKWSVEQISRSFSSTYVKTECDWVSLLKILILYELFCYIMMASLCLVKLMFLSNLGKSFHVFCSALAGSLHPWLTGHTWAIRRVPAVFCMSKISCVSQFPPGCFPWGLFIKHLFKSLEEWSLEENQGTWWKSQSQTEILVLLWWVSWGFHMIVYAQAGVPIPEQCSRVMCVISAAGNEARAELWGPQRGGAGWAWHPEVFASWPLWLQPWFWLREQHRVPESLCLIPGKKWDVAVFSANPLACVTGRGKHRDSDQAGGQAPC